MNPLQLKLARSSIAVAIASFFLGFTVSAIAQSDASKRMDDMPGTGANMSGPTSKEGVSNKATPTTPPKERPKKNKPRSTAAPMDHGQMQGMPGMKGGSSGMKDMPGMKGGSSDMKDMPGMNMESTGMGPMQGGNPPPVARYPDAYAEGMPKMAMPGMDMADDERYGQVLVNELEYPKGRDARGQNLNVEAWYGGDYNKLWIKAEGERRAGRLDAFRTEALWDHAIATFWSTQLGVRHDNGGGGRSRSWLAFGVQGLAPYWFETEATAYVGSGGTLAARVELRYEVLLTQKWILQPKLEANFYSKNDPQRGIGSGLSDLELGVRLRYEVTRQFAPYLGVTWSRKIGNTATYARQAGERVRDTQFVAGVRFWF